MSALKLHWFVALGLLGGCEELFEEVGAPSVRGDTPPAAPAPEGEPAASEPGEVVSLEAHAAGLDLQPLGDGSFVHHDRSGRRVATVTPDGRVRFTRAAPESPRPGVPMPGLAEAGREQSELDRTRFLEETAEFRGRLRAIQAGKVSKARLAALPRELSAIWRDDARTPIDRRKILFQRWDETFDPDGQEALDVADPSARALARVQVESAAAARLAIERFVRERLPAGSPDGYSSAELARLNEARSGGQLFAPYGSTGEADEQPAVVGESG